MATVRRSKKSRFSSISNALLQDSSLSFECRGMLAYLLSKPATWECKVYDIEREGGIKITARRRIMMEAEKAGYLTFSKYRNEKGQFESSYTVHEEPVPEDARTQSWNNSLTDEPPPENPQAGNPEAGNPPAENLGGLEKTDKESTDKEKKEGKPPAIAPDISIALEELYPGHSTNYRLMLELVALVSKCRGSAADVRRFPVWLQSNYPKKGNTVFAFKDFFHESMIVAGSSPVPKVYCGSCKSGWIPPGPGEDRARRCSCNRPSPAPVREVSV